MVNGKAGNDMFSEDELDDMLWKYMIGSDEDALFKFDEISRDKKLVLEMGESAKKRLFFDNIDSHSLGRYGFVPDGYESLEKTEGRKERFDLFAGEKAGKENLPEPENFAFGREDDTLYYFLYLKMKERFEEDSERVLPDFDKLFSFYDGKELVKNAKDISFWNLETIIDHLYSDLKSRYKEASSGKSEIFPETVPREKDNGYRRIIDKFKESASDDQIREILGAHLIEGKSYAVEKLLRVLWNYMNTKDSIESGDWDSGKNESALYEVLEGYSRDGKCAWLFDDAIKTLEGVFGKDYWDGVLREEGELYRLIKGFVTDEYQVSSGQKDAWKEFSEFIDSVGSKEFLRRAREVYGETKNFSETVGKLSSEYGSMLNREAGEKTFYHEESGDEEVVDTVAVEKTIPLSDENDAGSGNRNYQTLNGSHQMGDGSIHIDLRSKEEMDEGMSYFAERWGNIKNYVKENKKKFINTGLGAMLVGALGYLLVTHVVCPPKKQREVPIPPAPKVEKARPQEKAVYELKPSESLLSNDIDWIWEQDSSKWDVLPPAEDSKIGDHTGRNYSIYTDVCLSGNVVSLAHRDASNKEEEVEYIGVKIGKEGRWVYLRPGSRFDIGISPEEAEILRKGGELEYQVVGLGEGKNGKHGVKVSYKNAKLNLSREVYRELLRQELMEGTGSSVKKKPNIEMGAYSLLDSKEFKESFHNYIDKRGGNGENLDALELDDLMADFTGSITEMYNEGTAPWKIGKAYGMSTQDVYRAISASREFGSVVKPSRYNKGLFNEIFNANYA